ncbi:MAG TPA: universal stress protein [Candidatus Lustribacter sp.]|jgi:nucleotide-binding universal stress UspA family protein|nr:universal stress protein [Candidatus Lustribacter sp.]
MPPFSRVLVPYDGSEPAKAALTLAIALGKHGASVFITTVVDEIAAIEESADGAGIDPSPVMEALDQEGQARLDEASALCRAAGITPGSKIVHDTPVGGILASLDVQKSELVIMGTHARDGLARTFLGSTTEGVLRLSRVPVLTVRVADHVADMPFATIVVAIDDSEPADAAAALAARLQRDAKATVSAAYAYDTTSLYRNAGNFGFNPEELEEEMKDDGATIVKAALARAKLPADTTVAVVEGEPVAAIIGVAEKAHATLIVTGTHGRRGIRRFMLGSVAEHLVRSSPMPVLVVPVPREANA